MKTPTVMIFFLLLILLPCLSFGQLSYQDDWKPTGKRSSSIAYDTIPYDEAALAEYIVASILRRPDIVRTSKTPIPYLAVSGNLDRNRRAVAKQ